MQNRYCRNVNISRHFIKILPSLRFFPSIYSSSHLDKSEERILPNTLFLTRWCSLMYWNYSKKRFCCMYFSKLSLPTSLKVRTPSFFSYCVCLFWPSTQSVVDLIENVQQKSESWKYIPKYHNSVASYSTPFFFFRL